VPVHLRRNVLCVVLFDARHANKFRDEGLGIDEESRNVDLAVLPIKAWRAPHPE
jgi:hypothetical protein